MMSKYWRDDSNANISTKETLIKFWRREGGSRGKLCREKWLSSARTLSQCGKNSHVISVGQWWDNADNTHLLCKKKYYFYKTEWLFGISCFAYVKFLTYLLVCSNPVHSYRRSWSKYFKSFCWALVIVRLMTNCQTKVGHYLHTNILILKR